MILAEGHQITETKLDVRVQTGSAELVEQIAGEWRRLCDESGDEEVFYRPEWAQAYLQAFDSQASVTIITAWEGERLRGVLPLVWRRIIGSGLPITRLTLPSNLHSLRASLTVCPGQEGEAALRLLWQATRNSPSRSTSPPICR